MLRVVIWYEGMLDLLGNVRVYSCAVTVLILVCTNGVSFVKHSGFLAASMLTMIYCGLNAYAAATHVVLNLGLS